MNKLIHTGSLKDESGFSLAELLVVMALMGILATLISGVFLFGQERLSIWRSGLKLQNELHTILNGVTEDIYRANTIRVAEGSLLELELPESGMRTYQLADGLLALNDAPLNGPETAIIEFRLVTESGEPAGDSREVEGQSDLPGSLIHIALAVANGTDTLRSRRTVSLRQGSTWNPLR